MLYGLNIFIEETVQFLMPLCRKVFVQQFFIVSWCIITSSPCLACVILWKFPHTQHWCTYFLFVPWRPLKKRQCRKGSHRDRWYLCEGFLHDLVGGDARLEVIFGTEMLPHTEEIHQHPVLYSISSNLECSDFCFLLFEVENKITDEENIYVKFFHHSWATVAGLYVLYWSSQLPIFYIVT